MHLSKIRFIQLLFLFICTYSTPVKNEKTTTHWCCEKCNMPPLLTQITFQSSFALKESIYLVNSMEILADYRICGRVAFTYVSLWTWIQFHVISTNCFQMLFSTNFNTLPIQFTAAAAQTPIIAYLFRTGIENFV